MTAPTLAKAAAKPAPSATSRGGEDFAGEEVGLRIGAEIGHEVEQHETGENQQHLRSVGEVRRQRRQHETHRATQEADDLQRNSAHRIGQQNREYDADDQERGDQGGSLGGRDVVGDQIGDAAGMVGIRADRRGEDRRGEDADAIGPEILQEPGNRREDGRAAVGLVEQRKIALLGSSLPAASA
jgi:hypothetical protein